MANFTAGAVLTASALNTAFNTQTINAQTGTSYTFGTADAGELVTLSNASGGTATIPANATWGAATGTQIDAVNVGTGTWTIGTAAGVTVNGTTSVPTNGRVTLLKTATNTWYSSAMDAAIVSKVVQIVSSTYSTATTISSTSYSDTGLSASITPTKSTNKVLVIAFQEFNVYRSGNDTGHGVQLVRGASTIFTPDATGVQGGYMYAVGATYTNLTGRTPIMYLDSPATTSATTYKLQGRAGAAGITVVYQDNSSISQILLVEVSA